MPTDWKSVPKPPAAAALATNTAGLPVPWVAGWGPAPTASTTGPAWAGS